MHTLPPPEAIRSIFPYVNERMRKRRCFADKDLDASMFERERLLDEQHRKMALLNQTLMSRVPIPANVLEAQHAFANLPPVEFLLRIFPMINPNVLELVYQGCGGNLEKTIEQLVNHTNKVQLNKTQLVVGKCSSSQTKQGQDGLLPAFNANLAVPHTTPPSATSVSVSPSSILKTDQFVNLSQQKPPPVTPTEDAPPPICQEILSPRKIHSHILAQTNCDLLTQRSAFQPGSAVSFASAHAPPTKSPSQASCSSQSEDTKCSKHKTDKKVTTVLKFSVAALIGE